jgi:hypothetical protein
MRGRLDVTDSSVAKLRALTQPPAAVAFFRGLFKSVGVVVDESEEFTVRHEGEKISFEEGIETSAVDFTVYISREQLERLASEVDRGHLGTDEEYRVVRTLFTPATQALLKNPVMSSAILRKALGMEDLVHVRLCSPIASEPDGCHTLIYAAKQWIIVPGLVGHPKRVFEISVADAVEFQRQSIEALQKESLEGWLSFATWYKTWRKSVSRRT